MSLLLSYSQVLDLLMAAGLRYREVRRLLRTQQLPPVKHGMHSQRRWSRVVVERFMVKMREEMGQCDLETRKKMVDNSGGR
jgi:hypothetical protein